MFSDGKILEYFSVHLQDSSRHDLAASRLFAKYRDRQPQNVKDIHNSVQFSSVQSHFIHAIRDHDGGRPQRQWFDIYFFTVWSRCPFLMAKILDVFMLFISFLLFIFTFIFCTARGALVELEVRA